MFNMDGDNPARILIIDDDIDLLMLLERRLKQEGFEVETAASLQEAQEIVPYFLPQIILLDINVNGDDGRVLCYELKNDPKLVPVKVMMMSGFDISQGRAILFGADELVSKPLNMEYILLRIGEFLKQVKEIE
jgi:DNA-binding response OmpR family regulator